MTFVCRDSVNKNSVHRLKKGVECKIQCEVCLPLEETVGIRDSLRFTGFISRSFCRGAGGMAGH